MAQGVILQDEWLTHEWLVEHVKADGSSTLVIPEEAGFKGIVDRAFEGFTGEEVILPRGVIYIGKEAFKGLENLRHVVLPEELECIDESAFENCYELSELMLPRGLKMIRRCAFCGCESLEEVVIPSSVREIGKLAFYRCGSLSRLKIKNGVKYIGMRAFGDCASLRKFYKWNLPRTMGVMYLFPNLTRTRDLWRDIFQGSPCENGYWEQKARKRRRRKVERQAERFARKMRAERY